MRHPHRGHSPPTARLGPLRAAHRGDHRQRQDFQQCPREVRRHCAMAERLADLSHFPYLPQIYARQAPAPSRCPRPSATDTTTTGNAPWIAQADDRVHKSPALWDPPAAVPEHAAPQTRRTHRHVIRKVPMGSHRNSPPPQRDQPPPLPPFRTKSQHRRQAGCAPLAARQAKY